MAYRQLCAVTFAALGLVAVGCGGNTSTSASTTDPAVQAPTNPDQPSSNSDQASNPDQAPSNPDQAPGSADAPAGTGGGGHLVALCNELCSSLDKHANGCGNGMGQIGMNSICSDSAKCQIPANFPCQNEIADAFSCVLDNLDVLCSTADQATPGGDQNTAAPAEPCQGVAHTYTACLQAAGVTDTGSNQPPDKTPNANCKTRGGCDCSTACLKCQCNAGTDVTALQACATDACAP